MPQDEIIMDLVRRVDGLEKEIAYLRSHLLFSAPTNFGTNATITMSSDNPGLNGFTLVTRFEVASLILPSLPISRVRLTFQGANAEPTTITNAYIGHAAISGDAYDFLSTPVQLKFNGGNSSVLLPIGGSVTSDNAVFNYNKINALVVAMYINGGAASDTVRQAGGISNATSYFRAATNEAGTVNKTAGYGVTANLVYSINKIESNGFN